MVGVDEGAGVAAATIGAVSEGTGTHGKTDATTVGRTDGAESWDGKEGGRVGNTFCDETVHIAEGTSPSSCPRAQFPWGCGCYSIGESTSWGFITTFHITLVLALLVRLGGISSSAEITCWVRICGSCDIMGGGE